MAEPDWERLFEADRIVPPDSGTPERAPEGQWPHSVEQTGWPARPEPDLPRPEPRPTQAQPTAGLGLVHPPLGWKRYPAVTAIVVVTLVAYVIQLAWPRWADDVALFGPDVRAGEFWRLVTVVLGHVSWLHVGSNMAALAIWGRPVERRLGSVGLVGVYLTTAVGASAASMLVHPDQLSIGASGAVFGVMGAIIAVLVRELRQPGTRVELQLALGFAFFSLVVAAAFPNVDTIAHVGGLLSGFAIGGLVDTLRHPHRSG